MDTKFSKEDLNGNENDFLAFCMTIMLGKS